MRHHISEKLTLCIIIFFVVLSFTMGLFYSLGFDNKKFIAVMAIDSTTQLPKILPEEQGIPAET